MAHHERGAEESGRGEETHDAYRPPDELPGLCPSQDLVFTLAGDRRTQQALRYGQRGAVGDTAPEE